MAEDMGMFLEQVIKKTNPEEYIKILEQDREDFAEEINRLNNIINKAIEYINKYKNQNWYTESRFTEELLNKLKGDNK